jgi:hypothetical protein
MFNSMRSHFSFSSTENCFFTCPNTASDTIPQQKIQTDFTIKGYYAGLGLGFGSRKKSSKNAEKLNNQAIVNSFYVGFTN